MLSVCSNYNLTALELDSLKPQYQKADWYQSAHVSLNNWRLEKHTHYTFLHMHTHPVPHTAVIFLRKYLQQAVIHEKVCSLPGYGLSEMGTTETKSGICEFWPSAGERGRFLFLFGLLFLFYRHLASISNLFFFCNEDSHQVLLWATEKPPKERKRGPGLMATCVMHVDEFSASLGLQWWEFTPAKSWMISGQG